MKASISLKKLTNDIGTFTTSVRILTTKTGYWLTSVSSVIISKTSFLYTLLFAICIPRFCVVNLF